MTDSIASTILTQIIEVLVRDGTPAIVGLVTGGTGGAVLAKLLTKNRLTSLDFKIITEKTELVFSPGPAQGRLRVNVLRKFNLKLRDMNRKGFFEYHSELSADSVTSGRWSDCHILLNARPIQLEYRNDDSVIKSAPCEITSQDSLMLTLNSTEIVARSRGFYALVINNQKEQSTMQWDLRDFHENAPAVRAFASSEDFDLMVLQCGQRTNINDSTHPVTYFFAWAEELFIR